jgi:hypothetical protein
MDVVENGTYTLGTANRAWNIPMNSISDHMNGKTKSKKMGLGGVPIEKKDVAVIAWTLTSISLKQLKSKVAKLTQTRATPFHNEILGNNWWY